MLRWHPRPVKRPVVTDPVGVKRPNLLGLHDMRGNVFGCCQDHFDKDDYLRFEVSGRDSLNDPLEGDDRAVPSVTNSCTTLLIAINHPLIMGLREPIIEASRKVLRD